MRADAEACRASSGGYSARPVRFAALSWFVLPKRLCNLDLHYLQELAVYSASPFAPHVAAGLRRDRSWRAERSVGRSFCLAVGTLEPQLFSVLRRFEKSALPNATKAGVPRR